jgi:predicted nuclease with TOPRIM domain
MCARYWRRAQAAGIRTRIARLEAELSGVRELLKVHREQIDDLRTERDKLLNQVDATHRLLTHHQAQTPAPVERRPWWKRLAG